MDKINRIVMIIFLTFIGGVACLHILTIDMDFSETENRYLTKMPTLTIEGIVSGDFMSELEEYLSDQFAMREFWIGLKAKVEKALGKRENNGIYFGKDGYLFENFHQPKEQLGKNVASISYFIEKAEDVSVYMMLVPTSVEIYPEKLPLFAEVANQKEIIEEVKHALTGRVDWIDIYESLLQGKNQQIYFKTDHHWTTRGAYIAYKEAAKLMGFTPFEQEDFNIEIVSTDFYGTHYTRAQDKSVLADRIEIFHPKFDVSYQVEINHKGLAYVSLYDLDYLEKRDQYSIFLYGNQSLVKIKSHMGNGRKLLVIKDSYAHVLVPFLTNHYEEIHMIDLRYFRENLKFYMVENNLTDVLFVYNVANFAEDTNLFWLRQQ